MFKFNAGSSVGFIILLGVLLVSVLNRGQAEISYLDWHAAAVVLGGVAGSLLLALKSRIFLALILDWTGVIVGRDRLRYSVDSLREEMAQMQSSWRAGRRPEVLNLVDSSGSSEIRAAAEALVQHLTGHRLAERFEVLRARCQEELLPQIEGWDMVARLAPSFGIVGTVAGMVQLFRNMASNSGNLGGAMALSLLATFYGIFVGTALGGPMSTRVNQILADRLGLIDLLERQVAAMIEEDSER